MQHPWFTQSIIKNPQSKNWGSHSIYENAYLQKHKDLYSNNSHNIFTMQQQGSKLNLNMMDNDWDIDNELDKIMKDNIPNHLQEEKETSVQQKANLNGNNSFIQNGSFLASGKNN